MSGAARRRSHARLLTANIPAGTSLVIPSVQIPSPPFLDEYATPARFRKVLLVAAGVPTATAVALWTMNVFVSVQPTSDGPVAQFTLPAAATSNLAMIHEITAPPGASISIQLNNGAGAGDTVLISYGAIVAPAWVDPTLDEAY
jgi:hypothetical protein